MGIRSLYSYPNVLHSVNLFTLSIFAAAVVFQSLLNWINVIRELKFQGLFVLIKIRERNDWHGITACRCMVERQKSIIAANDLLPLSIFFSIAILFYTKSTIFFFYLNKRAQHKNMLEKIKALTTHFPLIRHLFEMNYKCAKGDRPRKLVQTTLTRIRLPISLLFLQKVIFSTS